MLKKLLLPISLISYLIIAGCGGGGGSSAPTVGQFIDDPVGGLGYSCTGAGAATNSGTTNPQGQFNYSPGQSCTFTVGNVTLGAPTSISTDGKVTPQDVAGVTRSATTAPSALAIAQFLQSLNDGSASGQIIIPTAVTTALSSSTVAPVTLVSTSGTIAQSNLQNLVTSAGKTTLVTPTAAKSALDTQIASGVVSTSTGAVSTSAPIVLTSITISDSATPPAGITDQLVAKAIYSDGSISDVTKSVTWTSSDPTIVTVDTNGLATGIKKGNTTVTASYAPTNGSPMTSSFSETVLDPTPLNIAIAYVQSGLTTLQNAASTTLQAILTLSNNATQTISSLVNWVVTPATTAGGNATVAVDTTANTATLTATSPGSVALGATYSGLSSNSLSLSITTTITGTAASGLALPGAAITANCSNGTLTTTSATDGTYTINGAIPPCILSASSQNSAGTTVTYYSAVPTGSSASATANITPLTHLAVASVIGLDPSTLTSSTVGSYTSLITPSALSTAASNTIAAMSAVGINLPSTTNPFSTTLKAATQDTGISTDQQDQALDQLMVSLAVASTPLSSVTSSFTSPASASSSSALTTSVTTLAKAKQIPQSSLSGCPSAISGLFTFVNVGFSNISTSGSVKTPTFGMVAINFSNSAITINNPSNSSTNVISVPANSAVKQDGTQMMIVASASNPCAFSAKTQPNGTAPVTNGQVINFEVSKAGFLVASGGTLSIPADVSTPNGSISSSKLGSMNCSFNTICTGLQIAIPVQNGIKLSDGTGTWQTVEWNCVSSSCGTEPTSSAASSNLFVNYYEQLVFKSVSATQSQVTPYACDGLASNYNTSSGTKTCSTSANTASVPVVSCITNNDCPTFGSTGVTATNIFESTATGVNIRTAVFKAANNDLIGLMIGFNGLFTELMGIAYQPANAPVLPIVQSTVNNPQWKTIGRCKNNVQCSYIVEIAEKYTVTAVNAATTTAPASVTRTWLDNVDYGSVDTAYIDVPYKGMFYRPYTTQTSGNNFNEITGIRGNGWSVYGGTATVSAQKSSSALPSTTGSYFGINIKY